MLVVSSKKILWIFHGFQVSRWKPSPKRKKRARKETAVKAAVKRRRVVNPAATRERRERMVVMVVSAAMETDGMKSLEKPARGFERKPECVIIRVSPWDTLRSLEPQGCFRMFLPPTNAGHFAIVSFQDDSLVPSKVANDNGIVFTNIDDCVGTILELYLVVFLCRFLCFHAARTRLTRSHNSHMALTFVDHPYKKFPIRAVADPKVPS